MINRFRKKFGSPDQTIIGFGDWEQKKQMKFHEPTKGKGFRKLFRQAGYQVFLVDEYRTSCRCYNCEGECATFRKRHNPRPWRRWDEIITVHGLLMCKTCKGLWNRDKNSSLNIYRIVEQTLKGNGRPEYLSRKRYVSGTPSVSLT